ncbi:threonylcarbamoyl-AMP synthase [Patescibacteria group bacterium]|nr:threonylcarbamoyl-AMP synthase [Patescibacteria group bacterium]MBU1034529.1 threonylcarbamoyl-AMP synthase [Patescibacteria group bacterium]MBU1907529.1 threonylcarbamoyl-AMP synthase [Patescibacteria group bacterium]
MQQRSEGIAKAVVVLRSGGVIAYPTETVYGLGCDPRNPDAIQRIFKMKGRTRRAPFLLVASSVAQVRKVAKLNGKGLTMARKYWPGPLTLVLPAKLGKKDIAIRVSSSNFVQALTRAYGFPIVSTSANISGQPEARSGQAVRKIFKARKEQPDLVIDVGSLPRRKASTVARVRGDGTIEVLRKGAIRI